MAEWALHQEQGAKKEEGAKDQLIAFKDTSPVA